MHGLKNQLLERTWGNWNFHMYWWDHKALYPLWEIFWLFLPKVFLNLNPAISYLKTEYIPIPKE